MSAPSATITVFTTWPLMSRPRISSARAAGLLRAPGDLDAAGLAAAAGLHLGLDDDDGSAELGRGALRLLGGGRGDAAEHGDPVRLEHVPGLVLVQIHSASWSRPARAGHRLGHPDPARSRCRPTAGRPWTSLVVGGPPAPDGVQRPRSSPTWPRTQATMSAIVAPGVKTSPDAQLQQRGPVGGRDDPAAEDHDVGGVLGREQLQHPGEQGQVGARQHRQARPRRRPRPGRSGRSARGSGAGRCR